MGVINLGVLGLDAGIIAKIKSFFPCIYVCSVNVFFKHLFVAGTEYSQGYVWENILGTATLTEQ